MALNKFLIRKWLKMLTGRSIYHVNQGVGKAFSPDYISGYFNDLTEKVRKQEQFVDRLAIPVIEDQKGKRVFPIAVYQYGLGCYDLYTLTKEKKYLDEFILISKWSANSVGDDGEIFAFPENKGLKRFSAMAQGECISVLCRAYDLTQKSLYIEKAKKAAIFMIGALSTKNDISFFNKYGLAFYEFPEEPIVLNGWIFSIFGFRDLFLTTSETNWNTMFFDSCRCLIRRLPEYDLGYWSRYDSGTKIASPFYHSLHISQLQALYLVTKNAEFNRYSLLFSAYRNNLLYKLKAFTLKSIQKLKE